MTEVTELVTKFGFEGSPEPLAQYNKNLGGAIGLLAGMTAALGAATAAMGKFTTNTLQGLEPLLDLTTQTRTNIADLREWGFIARQTGSDAETLEGSIASLSQSINSAIFEGSEDFARFGISIRDANGGVKDAGEIFLEVRDRVQQMNLSFAETQALVSTLGIDESLVPMLRLTSAEFDTLSERARRFGEITEEQKEIAKDYTESVADLAFGMDTLKTLVAVGFAPTMQRLSDTMADLLASNQDLIVDGLEVLGKWLGNIGAALVRLTPTIGVLLGLWAAWKIATVGLAGVMGVLASPVVLISGLLIALLLVVDDLIVAFRGGQSVIADFFQEFLGFDIQALLQGIVDGFLAMIGKMREGWRSFVDGIATLFEAFAALFKGDVGGFVSLLGEAVSQMFGLFRGFVQGLIALFAGVFEGIWAGLPQEARDAIRPVLEAVDTAIGAIVNIASGGFNLITAAWETLVAVIQSLFSGLVALLKGDFQGFVEGVTGAGSIIIDSLSSLADSILSIFSDIWDKIWAMLPVGAKEAISGIQEIASMLLDDLLGRFKGVFDFASGLLDDARGAAGQVGSFLGFGDEDEQAKDEDRDRRNDPFFVRQQEPQETNVISLDDRRPKENLQRAEFGEPPEVDVPKMQFDIQRPEPAANDEGGVTRQQPPEISIVNRIAPGDVPTGQTTFEDNRTVQQSNEINVTSPDPEAAGRSVDRALERQLRDADQHFKRGGGAG